MIDTHCHLYVAEILQDIDEIMDRAGAAGVSEFYLPAIDSSTHDAMMQLEERFPDRCKSMIGLHPCSVKENYKEELAQIKELLQTRNFSGIGETGLDFYWDTSFKEQQYAALETQVEWALQYKLPLILHTRNATQQTIDVVKNYVGTGLRGIFHCFGGSLHEAQQVIECNFMLGIGGVLTYKNSGLADVIKNIDMAHIVLETDAPYLAPVPFRGKRNESSYLPAVAQKLAEIKNIPVDEVDRLTTANAKKIFG